MLRLLLKVRVRGRRPERHIPETGEMRREKREPLVHVSCFLWQDKFIRYSLSSFCSETSGAPLSKSFFIISMHSFDITILTKSLKTRIAALSFAAFLAFASIYFFLSHSQRVRTLPESYRSYVRGQPASKLSRFPGTHHLSHEELALKLNDTSDTVCGGIDVNAILHVKAVTIIDPDLDTFLSESDHYPHLGLPSSTWEDEKERAYWVSINAVALWRPRSRTYWTINRIYYYKGRLYTHPIFSYLWWEEWNESGSQRVGSGILPIFVPQHRDKKDRPEGPEDPRLFEDPDGHVCFVFGMLDLDDRIKIWMYNTTSERQVALHSPDGREPRPVEKNWTPIVHDGHVKFIFSYKPLTVIACDFFSGACHFDHTEERNPDIGEFHGGSNWVPWYDSGYYVAFARTRINRGHVLYRLNLVVLSGHAGIFRIAYASGPLDLHNVTLLEPLGPHGDASELDEREPGHGRLLLSESITRTDLFDQNSIMITVSTSDNSTTLLELGGIRDVMEAVIAKAERESSWRTDDGKVIDCAERAATKHYYDVFNKFDLQS